MDKSTRKGVTASSLRHLVIRQAVGGRWRVAHKTPGASGERIGRSGTPTAGSRSSWTREYAEEAPSGGMACRAGAGREAVQTSPASTTNLGGLTGSSLGTSSSRKVLVLDIVHKGIEVAASERPWAPAAKAGTYECALHLDTRGASLRGRLAGRWALARAGQQLQNEAERLRKFGTEDRRRTREVPGSSRGGVGVSAFARDGVNG